MTTNDRIPVSADTLRIIKEHFPWASEDFLALNCQEKPDSSSNLSNFSKSSPWLRGGPEHQQGPVAARSQSPTIGKAPSRRAKAGKETAPHETEAVFQGKVIQYAQLQHWRVAHFRPAKTEKGWRTAVSADGAGFPDLILARGACVIAAELKSETGKVSEEQAAWLAAFKAAGVLGFVWRPSDWETLVEVLL